MKFCRQKKPSHLNLEGFENLLGLGRFKSQHIAELLHQKNAVARQGLKRPGFANGGTEAKRTRGKPARAAK